MIGSEGTSSLVVVGQASPKVPLALIIEPGEVQGIFHARGRGVNRHDGLGLNTMQPIIDYILNNKEWIFSGIGIFLLSGMIWFLSRLLFSNSPRTYGESGSHTTVHPERIKRESDIEARDNVGHRFEFLDGVIAYARLRGSYTIEDAKLFFSSFKSNDECRKLFAPLIHARACYLLEKYPFAEAKLHRREVEMAHDEYPDKKCT